MMHNTIIRSCPRGGSLVPPPARAHTGSLDFVVTLEQNGCCEFFSLKALEHLLRFLLWISCLW